MSRIALAQFNPTVGDLAGNSVRIVSIASCVSNQGAELVVFPELSLIGYPPRDLLFDGDFVLQSERALNSLTSQLSIAALIGTIKRTDDGKLYNGIAYIADGMVKSFSAKRLLPNYEVFNEPRYFAPGDWQNAVVSTPVGRLLVLICEDMLAAETNFARYSLCEDELWTKLSVQTFDAVVCAAASPYRRGHFSRRTHAGVKWATKFNRPVMFVNQVGGNDGLIFDGCSYVLGPRGTLSALGESFAEDSLIVNVDGSHSDIPWPRIDANKDDVQVKAGLVRGIGDYFAKTGFKKACLGLSGGVDSALVACLAVEALGSENVTALTMPSPYTASSNLADAAEIASNLGMKMLTVPIEGAMSAVSRAVNAEPLSLIEENLQSRLRGLILMAHANAEGSLVLSCGNKSELAVGYATLYGDMCGALSPIGDLYKTDVWELAAAYSAIPPKVVSKPPTAELRPNQHDTDSLPPYDLLDGILRHLLEGAPMPDKCESSLIKYIAQLVKIAEFKRRQSPIVLKVSDCSFGLEWQYPVARGC